MLDFVCVVVGSRPPLSGQARVIQRFYSLTPNKVNTAFVGIIHILLSQSEVQSCGSRLHASYLLNSARSISFGYRLYNERFMTFHVAVSVQT